MSTFTGTLISQKPTADGQFNQWILQHENQQTTVLVPAKMMKFYSNVDLGKEYTATYQANEENKYILSEISVGTTSKEEKSTKATANDKSEQTTAEKMEAARRKQTKYMDDLLNQADTKQLPIAALTTNLPEVGFMLNNNTQLEAIFTATEEKDEKVQKESQSSDEDLGTKDEMRKENEEDEQDQPDLNASSTTNHVKTAEEMKTDSADMY